MTAPLKWRSQLCPCGYCPDGTRIEWRYTIDIRFRPRRRVSGETALSVRDGGLKSEHTAAANPSGFGSRPDIPSYKDEEEER